jgi:hypothetical protein
MSHIATVLDRLRKAGARVPELPSPYPLKPPRFGPGCTPAEVEELLGDASVHVPEYAQYLGLCRRIDAPDVFCGYFLHSPLQVARQTSSQPRLLHVDEGPGNQAEVRVLVIGSDGGGNLFLMGTSPPHAGSVWKWNHEHEVRFDGMAKDGLTLVAPSVGGFLDRLATDWEHFANGDRAWSYFAG